MRLRAWLWLALSSFRAVALWGETRPHYGGALTLDLSTTFNTLEPSDLPPVLATLVGQTLVRVNSHGEMEPVLAVSWQREAEGRRWRISLRSKVTFQDGETMTAGNVAPVLLAALRKTYGDVAITAGGSTLVIQSDNPLPDLPAELSNARTAIVRKSDAGIPIGTGPFRVVGWEPGRRLTLAAFEDYWGGRPFLDSVIVNLGSNRITGDIFDIPFASPRRIVPETTRIWQSAPEELLALVTGDVQPAVSDALALAVDRTPIANVLAQRRGQAAFGLLPQWLSGYEFLFQTAPDLARARQLVSQLKLNALTLGYAPGDSFAHAVADRIALNARDAGINIQPSPNANAPLRLVRWTIESADAAAELARLVQLAGLAERAVSLDASPETLYNVERAALGSYRVIPLAHLSLVYGLAPRVHVRDTGSANALTLHLEDVWVDP